MDVVLISFSQTENTGKVGAAMASALREAGHSARTIPLKDATPEQVTKSDLLGVGTPCFSGRAPTPVKRFLRALPALHDKRAFVFATSSGAPGRVLYDLTSLLRRRGAHVLGGFLARGQVHHPAPRLSGQFTGRPNAADLRRARAFALALVEQVLADRSGPLPGGRPDALKRGWSLYHWLGLISSDRLLRLVMPQPILTSTRCNQCGRCVRECPVGNITIREAPVDRAPNIQGAVSRWSPALGEQCIRCYHCLVGCPEQAFGADWRWVGRFLWLLYSPTSMRRFGDVGPAEQVY
jgi:ferredoxin